MGFSQMQALYLTVNEAESLLARIRGSQFLIARGVEVYTVPAEPMPFADGAATADAVFVMVRAETDAQCGMGLGFVTAISEGIYK